MMMMTIMMIRDEYYYHEDHIITGEMIEARSRITPWMDSGELVAFHANTSLHSRIHPMLHDNQSFDIIVACELKMRKMWRFAVALCSDWADTSCIRLICDGVMSCLSSL